MTCFVLGVGVPRAGAGWLHGYLERRSDADMGFARRYQIWDALTLPDSRRLLDNQIEASMKLLSGPAEDWIGTAPEAFRRITFLSDPEAYFDYFAARLAAPGIAVTGDITPTYATLSGETLTTIRDGFARRGISVCPVFLMRDPVERILSVTRVHFRNRGITPSPEEMMARVLVTHRSGIEQARSDYADIYRTLRQVFGAHVFAGFHETLFGETEIRRFCGFLGLPYRAADFERVINATPAFEALPEDFLNGLRQDYAPQYAFAREEFSRFLVNGIWTAPKAKKAGKRPLTT